MVDVGANVGTTVLAAAVAVGETGRVHAIEVNPRVFDFLVQNVELQRLPECARPQRRGRCRGRCRPIF